MHICNKARMSDVVIRDLPSMLIIVFRFVKYQFNKYIYHISVVCTPHALDIYIHLSIARYILARVLSYKYFVRSMHAGPQYVNKKREIIAKPDFAVMVVMFDCFFCCLNKLITIIPL